MLSRAIEVLKDLILPVYCPGCGKKEDGICNSCFDFIRTPLTLLCPHCPKPSLQGRPCGKHRKSALDKLVCASFYSEKTVAGAIGLVKYHGSKVLLPQLAAIFRRAMLQFKTLLPEGSLIIPMPSAPFRKRESNQNLVGSLAVTAARELNLELDGESLRRGLTVWTLLGLTQSAKLSHDDPARKWSTARAFQVKNNEKIFGKDILLIDDVSTSGSTLDAAARTLKNSGAKTVTALTLARG